MHVSVTRFNTYRNCPRSYKHRYLDRLGHDFTLTTPAMALGDSVHAALCAFFRDPDPDRRTREWLAQLLRRHWKRDAYRDADEERRYGLQALDMLDRYYFHHDMTVVPLLLEHDFKMRLGDCTLSGKIDRVDVRADGTHCLVEYKTGQHALTQGEAHDDLQLTVYALAFLALYGKTCERLELHYLAPGLDRVTARSAEQLAAARGQLAELAATMAADREFAPHPGPLCAHCAYVIMCPAGGDPQANEVQRLDAANRRLYLLLHAGNELSASKLDPALVLECAVATLGELLGAEHAAAVQVSEDQTGIVAARLAGDPAAAPEEFYARPEVGQCLQQEEPILRNAGPGDAARPEVFAPLFTRRLCRGFLYAARGPERPFSQNDFNLLRMYALQTALALDNAVHYREAISDKLTDAYNRAYFDRALDRELRRAAEGVPFALYLFDIDNFKKFNDTYGHLVGDLVLQSLARIVTATARKCDHVCRYGGEEFAVIMPGADLAGALDGAERIRAAIAQFRLPVENLTLAITVSGGVAACPVHGNDAVALVKYADRGLYRAKQLGKNRVALPDSA